VISNVAPLNIGDIEDAESVMRPPWAG